MSTYVIAEVGSTHDGDFGKAVVLVDQAAQAGADAVKFQFWSDPAALAIRRGSGPDYEAIYRRYALPRWWLEPLSSYARKRGIDFMCSTYLPQDVALVAPFVSHFKVASFEAEAGDLLRAHLPHLGACDKWIIISLGMGASPGTAQEVLRAYSRQVRYLHCVSAYPTPVGQMNLRRMRPHRFAFAGFSDHTGPDEMWSGAVAVAAGAEIVEAHLRLTTTDDANPDAPHAMRPEQFSRYVANIRTTERALGTGVPGVMPCEAPMASYRVVKS